MKKITFSFIIIFTFVLVMASVNADLNINPNTAQMTFSNHEESKTVEFTITNNWINDNMIINVEIESSPNLIEKEDFIINFENLVQNQSSNDVSITLNLNNINLEGFQNFIGSIPVKISYQNETDSNINGTEIFNLQLNIPAYNKEIRFNPSEINIDILPGGDFSRTFRLKNHGTVTVSEIILEMGDEDFINKFDISISQNVVFNLAPGEESNTITINGKVPSDMGVNSESSKLTASYNEKTAEMELKISGKSGLQFTDLEYDIRYPRRHGPNDIDGSIIQGTNIRVSEGARVIIEGYVENLFEDIELRRPTVYLDIRRMDRFEERINLRDIDAGFDEFFRFDFTVPYEGFRDRERFSAELYVEAEDRNTGRNYRTSITFELEIEKEREEVTIVEAVLENDVLACDRQTNLFVTIRNTGRDDLSARDRNTATLNILNNNLGLNEIISEIEMSSNSYDASNEQTFIIPIDASRLNPSSILQNIRIIAYHDRNRESDEANVFFRVDQCVTTTTTPPTTTTTTIAPTTTTTTLRQIIGPDAGIIPSEPATEDNERLYIILLIILIAIVVLIAGGMIGYLMKK